MGLKQHQKDAHSACVRMRALEADVPAEFEALVRGAVGKLEQLTGGTIANVLITTKSHTPGIILERNDWGRSPGPVSIEYRTTGLWVDINNGGNACFCSPVSETGPGHIVYGSNAGSDRAVHEHEVGHSAGVSHPSVQPTQLAFMYDHLDEHILCEITSADELHGRILYRRPNGSLSPDPDPVGVTIN
jgi:hypothetical protein